MQRRNSLPPALIDPTATAALRNADDHPRPVAHGAIAEALAMCLDEVRANPAAHPDGTLAWAVRLWRWTGMG